jgi:FtsP/CotA-like multicopper oxidase with cupredoxin domain
MIDAPVRRSLVLAALLLVACADEAASPDPDPTAEHPPTGHTVQVELEITEFDWEVAPGAIYRAIGYNRSIPGPIIEATAGDRIVIKLTNKTDSPRSIHTHVVRFAESSDGFMKGVAQPGETITVEWEAVFAGTFPYHDHAGHGGETEGITAGLVGALVVHDPTAPMAQVENVVVLTDLDMTRYAKLPEMDHEGGHAAGGHGYMHVINGRAYEEWVPRFAAKVGDRVRWRVLSLGAELHTFHVHGHRWVGADGVLTDAINLGPGTYATFDWVEDNPGEWLYHCHVPDHMEGGMVGIYEVAK